MSVGVCALILAKVSQLPTRIASYTCTVLSYQSPSASLVNIVVTVNLLNQIFNLNQLCSINIVTDKISFSSETSNYIEVSNSTGGKTATQKTTRNNERVKILLTLSS